MQIQNFMCSFFNEGESKYWFLIKLIFLSAAIFICGSIDAPAQNKGNSRKISDKQ